MFTAPLFLIAAAVGALVPLFLHVIQSKRRITVPFPTLRFLKMADKKSSRRARMEYFLLWLIRTLIMALLGFAFAMPTLRLSKMSWLGEAPRDIAIVIDASYSMGYSKGAKTVWAEAKATAAALLNGLGEKDRYCIYVAGEHPIPVIAEPVSDISDGLAQVKALELRPRSSHLASAVQAAHDALQLDTRSRLQELYILTDNQAYPWKSFGAKAVKAESDEDPDAAPENVSDDGEPGPPSSPGWDPGRVSKGTTMYVVRLGVDAPENVGVANIKLTPPVLFANNTAQLTASISRNGPPAATTLMLQIDGREVARRSFMIGSPDSAPPAFPLPPLEPGIHIGLLETPEDNLAIDNQFFFLLQVKEKLPALCVGTKEDTLYVRAALQAGAVNGIESTWKTGAELEEEPLYDYAAIFLCNALPLSRQAQELLEQYVRAGGLLAVFPGDRALVGDYQSMSWLPGLPRGIEPFSSIRRKKTLGWSRPNHPIVTPLRSGRSTPTMTIRRRLLWGEWPEQTVQLISMSEEEPFLLSRPLGRGQVLMMSSSADRVWGEFPLSPFFLPIIHQIVEYGAGISGVPPFIWGQRSLALGNLLPQVTRTSSMLTPDGRSVSIRSTLLDGRTRMQAEDVTAPGVYTLTQPDTGSVPALAVNIPREESDLTTLSEEAVRDLLGLDNVYLAQSEEELLTLVTDHRVGRTYGEQLLWLVFLLVVVEFVYANRLSRGRGSLSAILGVAASGKVSGGSS